MSLAALIISLIGLGISVYTYISLYKATHMEEDNEPENNIKDKLFDFFKEGLIVEIWGDSQSYNPFDVLEPEVCEIVGIKDGFIKIRNYNDTGEYNVISVDNLLSNFKFVLYKDYKEKEVLLEGNFGKLHF